VPVRILLRTWTAVSHKFSTGKSEERTALRRRYTARNRYGIRREYKEDLTETNTTCNETIQPIIVSDVTQVI
jgi:hypothetical protein